MMAGKIIEVDTTQLGRDKQMAFDRLMQMQSLLKGLYAEITELDAMWDGPANDAFNKQFAADREYFEAMCNEVRAFIDSLECAKTEYEKCENQVNSAVAAIRI